MQHGVVKIRCAVIIRQSVTLELQHTQVAGDVTNWRFFQLSFKTFAGIMPSSLPAPNHARLITMAVSDSPRKAENIGATLVVIQESVGGPRTFRSKQGQWQSVTLKKPLKHGSIFKHAILVVVPQNEKNIFKESATKYDVF